MVDVEMGTTCWLHGLWCFQGLVVLLCFQKGHCASIFTVKLVSFTNFDGRLLDGNCCRVRNYSSCVSCSIFARLCLTHVGEQLIVNDSMHLETTCSLGEKNTEIFGQNSFDLDGTSLSEGAITLEFNFDIPERCLLVIELRHKDVHDVGSRGELVGILRREIELKPNTHNPGLYADSIRSATLAYALSVRCADHYFGARCATHCRPRLDLDTCSNNGCYNCTADGQPLCLAGWQGQRCDKASCGNGCLHDGICSMPNMCTCRPGWKGARCEQCIPYMGCKNGFCNLPNECNCHPRWGGLTCDQDQDVCFHKQPCRNGARCVPHAVNNYTCICAQGFTGRDCDMPARQCMDNPCWNYGTCVETDTGYQCNCDALHSGRLCENTVLGGKVNRSCFDGVTGILYRHDQWWHTYDCKACRCSDGSVHCSEARCNRENCLEDPSTAMTPAASCLADQICRSVQTVHCLKQPCSAAPYGECIPHQLVVSDRHRASSCFNRSATAVGSCAYLSVAFDDERLPEGAAVETVCYHILLALLTDHIAHADVACEAVPEAPIPTVRVVLTSLFSQWPSVDDIKVILGNMLMRNVTASPLLQTIISVDGQTSSDALSHQFGVEPPDASRKVLLFAVLTPCVLVCAIAALCVSTTCLMHRRRQQRWDAMPNKVEPDAESPNMRIYNNLKNVVRCERALMCARAHTTGKPLNNVVRCAASGCTTSACANRTSSKQSDSSRVSSL